ncbi:MAG: Mu transposase C-terminal domain-containing protein [Pseudomonadota bacterium]|nr:Mu transposase C-terminal domain-containing protein [Pseudomonadota bacterium]
MIKTPKLTIGAEVHYEATSYVVEGFAGSVVVLRSIQGEVIRLGLRHLVASSSFKLIGRKENEVQPVLMTGVSKTELKAVNELAAHLLQAITGYKSGSEADALTGEPFAGYDPIATTMASRFELKAKELNVGLRTLWYQKKSYEAHGLHGLMDGRKIKLGTPKLDERIQQAISTVIDSLIDESNTTNNRIRRLVERELKAKYPDEEIAFPSESTFNRRLSELKKGIGLNGAAKQRRSIANRPDKPYSHFVATRPGEMVLIDSTPLDVYAMDPYSFQWIPVELTIALDLFTRSLVAWRFTPRGTKAVDAAFLLADMIKPKLKGYDWAESTKFAYVGIPESIVVEVGGDAPGSPLAAIPFIHPESVIVDRGRVFLSEAFSNACRHLGINLFIARPYTPTDKSHVERVFKTIRESFILNLDGYKGPDVWSRGIDPCENAFWFLDEIEMKFAEWVATHWQPKHHDGLSLPNVPNLHISPNNMFEEGIARAGFLYVVPDKNMYYELLPTDWRTIQHYGVDLRGLRYDGDILNDFRDQQSPYPNQNGKWPIRYDPRDRTFIAFYDHTLNQWHELHWTGMGPKHRPFNEMTVSYAKALVIENGGNTNNQKELEESLHRLLNRIDDQQMLGRKERRLAAVNMMNSASAARDKPIKPSIYAPDGEMEALSSDGDLDMWKPVKSVLDDHDANDASTPIKTFRTLAEAQDEDDDDDLFNF